MKLFPSGTAARRSERSRAWRLANPDRTREIARDAQNRRRERDPRGTKDRRLRRAFGITVEMWETMFAAQGFCCAICGAAEPGTKQGWHTDHCHITHVVRGILCHHCNLTIGSAKDDVVRLRAAIDYLERGQ